MTRTRTRSIDEAYGTARVLRGLAVDEPLPVVANRYQITGRIGEGSFGTVYSAIDLDLERNVAVKVLDLGDPEVDRREGLALAKLEHPNVVKIYDHGRESDFRYYVLQLLDGPTLRDWVADKNPQQIVEKFVEAGRGLAAAHAAGLVHRDFKPSNVRIDAEGRAVVVDFGLARHIDTVDRDPSATQVFEGTLAYCAPERLLGQPATPRSDQFSFCVALWEALSGTNPFGPVSRSMHPGARFIAIDAGVVGRPRGAKRVAHAVRKGLAVAPVDRWTSMEVLLGEIGPRVRAGWRRLDMVIVGLTLIALGLVARVATNVGAAGTGAPDIAGAVAGGQVEFEALLLADRGDAIGALQLLEAVERDVPAGRAGALTQVGQRVAEDLDADLDLDAAASAWLVTLRFARRAGDEEVEARARERLYAVAAELSGATPAQHRSR